MASNGLLQGFEKLGGRKGPISERKTQGCGNRKHSVINLRDAHFSGGFEQHKRPFTHVAGMILIVALCPQFITRVNQSALHRSEAGDEIVVVARDGAKAWKTHRWLCNFA